jgi:hypothetical protein
MWRIKRKNKKKNGYGEMKKMELTKAAKEKIKKKTKEDLLFDYYEKVMEVLIKLKQYYIEDKLNSEDIYKIILSLTQTFFDIDKKIDNTNIYFIIGGEEENED